MIFLGAGASKPFGIPTLEEFSNEVIEKLKALGHIDRYPAKNRKLAQ